jgi:hypothetical protein
MTKKGNDSTNMSLKYTAFDWETSESTKILKMFLLANVHVYDYDEQTSVA